MLHSLSLKSIHTFYTYAKYIPNIKIQITALVIVPIYVYFKNFYTKYYWGDKMLNLNTKEKSLLEDAKEHETLCVAKYKDHA